MGLIPSPLSRSTFLPALTRERGRKVAQGAFFSLSGGCPDDKMGEI